MSQKVTLKQIAELAGVSLTSVHRVLNGKEGCSEEVKQRILRIAREQGYNVNLAAATTSRQTIHIALLFPRNEARNRFFLQRILDGYLQFRSDLNQFNVVFHEFYTDTDHASPAFYLKQIYKERPVPFDGIIIYGLGVNSECQTVINRLVGGGVQIVLLERAPKALGDICSVEVNDFLAGNLAGEIAARYIHTSGTVAVIAQDLPDGDSNAEQFCAQLRRMNPDLNACILHLGLQKDQQEVIYRGLSEISDLIGVYSTCARHTASMLRILPKLPKMQAVIGSELFEESFLALQDRLLDAVIDKRPEKIGYKAAQLLYSSLLKQEPLPVTYRVEPRIILQSSSDVYYLEKENRYGKTHHIE